MGQGRRPKPTAQKKLAGNPGKRKLSEDEVQFDPLSGAEPPAHMIDEVAIQMWELLAPQLCAQKVLCITDLHNLEIFCESYSVYRAATREYAGLVTVMQESGVIKKNPALSARNEAISQINSVGALLGLSPADRTRIMSPQSKEDDNPFGKMLEMMKG